MSQSSKAVIIEAFKVLKTAKSNASEIKEESSSVESHESLEKSDDSGLLRKTILSGMVNPAIAR